MKLNIIFNKDGVLMPLMHGLCPLNWFQIHKFSNFVTKNEDSSNFKYYLSVVIHTHSLSEWPHLSMSYCPCIGVTSTDLAKTKYPVTKE